MAKRKRITDAKLIALATEAAHRAVGLINSPTCPNCCALATAYAIVVTATEAEALTPAQAQLSLTVIGEEIVRLLAATVARPN